LLIPKAKRSTVSVFFPFYINKGSSTSKHDFSGKVNVYSLSTTLTLTKHETGRVNFKYLSFKRKECNEIASNKEGEEEEKEGGKEIKIG